MTWQPGTGPSGKYYLDSDCGTWRICKGGNPPVYTLAKLGGQAPELIVSGTLEVCKERANENHLLR